MSPETATPELTSQDELEIMLTDIQKRESKLSDWELGFISATTPLIEAKTGLSEGRDRAFTAIWNRVTD